MRSTGILAVVGAMVIAACVERRAPPRAEVAAPSNGIEPPQLAAAECREAERVCGYGFARDCPGVEQRACTAQCVGSAAALADGGDFSKECKDCMWDYGVICGTARTAAESACRLLERCDEARSPRVMR